MSERYLQNGYCCSLWSRDDLNGKCWGTVDVVDEEDGEGIFCCEGHAELYRMIPQEDKNADWVEGEYIEKPR